MLVEDLGLIPYRDAWSLQEQIHAEVMAGAPERLLLLEHPPVITCGRRPDIGKNLLASQKQLADLGVELIQSDRGGDITFHGPGQLVAYPIIRLADRKLSVGAYVCRLQKLVIATLVAWPLNIQAQLDPPNIGVWVPCTGKTAAAPAEAMPSEAKDLHETSAALGPEIPRFARNDGLVPTAPPTLAKICSFGVRIRRNVSLHGLALNVSTDLSYFDLIVPCGLHRPVTSIQKILSLAAPSMRAIKDLLAQQFLAVFQ